MAYSSYLLPNYYGGGGTTPTISSPQSPMMNSPMMPMATGNPSAISRGTGFGSIGPDLSYADPNTLGRLQGGMSNQVYDVTTGGYHAASGLKNFTGDYYGKPLQFANQGNQAAGAYYNYLGSLPTRTYGTLALERLYQSTGQRPSMGASMNQRGGQSWQGPYGFNPNSSIGGGRY